MKGLFKGLLRPSRKPLTRAAKAVVKAAVKSALSPPAKPASSSFGSKFATPADDCRAAMDFVLAKLPPGFIDRARFEPAWSARHRDGTGGTRKVDLELKALLPPDDQWPALSPVCDLAPAPPSDLFLRTLTLEAYGIARVARGRESAALLPYLVFTTRGDTRTCPEHEAADGRVARITAKGVPAFVDWRWACRCTTLQVSRRVAKTRGHQLPD